MRVKLREIKKIAAVFAVFGLFVLIMAGCGDYSSPTASTTADQDRPDMWNPQPGDMMNGHEIPLLREGYWEDLYGPTVNPWMMPPRTFRVGPQGGYFVFGQHALWVPPGAVTNTVNITLSNASVTAVALDCYPSPYQFNVPITLYLSYDGTQYEGQDNPPLAIMYMTGNNSFEEMPGGVDDDHEIVTGVITHFSRYIIGAKTE
ncbi:hypothetical protein KKH27_11445 [bacterium]|nr:hypothetical protein [bacterium]MBU1984116.1 hypothetical protein [bacterium]